MSQTVSAFDNLRGELRRGCLVLAVLGALRSENNGYTLRKTLSDQGMDIDEGTLYPLLRRLETQSLLASEWRQEQNRNKRFYRLTEVGQETLSKLLAEWQVLDTAISMILKEKADETRPNTTLFAGR